MDIQSGVIALVVIALAFAFFSLRSGLGAIRSARKMTFYRLRRQREAGGRRLIGLAVVLVLLAVAMPLYGLPVVYEYFPPTPMPSLTPTITMVPTITSVPTITLSPTITDTPLVTDTPTITPTPSLPLAIIARFQSSVTPNPDVIFSPFVFCTQVDSGLQPIDANTVFENPLTQIIATYSYDKMIPGVQWTALWYREGDTTPICPPDSHPFAGGTGGYDTATSCQNPTGGWQPGIYMLQIFVGEEFMQSGHFLVEGNPPTLTTTITATFTEVPTHTPAPTSTPLPITTP